MKLNEIKTMTNDAIITTIFWMGIMAANDKTSQQREKRLQALLKELQDRGVIENWENAYAETLK